MTPGDAAKLVYDQIQFESTSRSSDGTIEIETEIDGRIYEIEFPPPNVCDITAEVKMQEADDRERDDDQALGHYDVYGPDQTTWADIARMEA